MSGLIRSPGVAFHGLLLVCGLLVSCGDAAQGAADVALDERGEATPAELVAEPAAGLSQRLERHVSLLAGLGERSMAAPASLQRAREYVGEQFRALGLSPEEHLFEHAGLSLANVWCELPGSTPGAPVVLLGAHYDSIGPGADDNASGVAALLELAALLRTEPLTRPVRFVAFVNEEPPCFQEACMGSRVYARRCKAAGEQVELMLSLESIGFWSDEPESQHYPPLLAASYPSTGDFVAFVSDLEHGGALQRFLALFRQTESVPSEGAVLPGALPGVGWSDHWSFWQEGYPALMVTDTALFRNPHYHEASDLPETLDYERMAALVRGLKQALVELSQSP
ncbi:MAG: aminopeptidase [Planctomycetota bacterium]|nr:MAG: aminopeptidase [Planctomycetota bacterium]